MNEEERGKLGGKPSAEQLARINQFTNKELTENDVYVFPSMMIDNQATSYSSKIHDNLLRKFMVDCSKGVGLLMNHNQRSLPVGRSFDSKMQEEYDTESGEVVKSVYGNFYIDLDRQTESGMSTSDLCKGIDAGTIFDTSIGFNADQWCCSICGNDIRDWRACSHYPGEKYVVSNNGADEVQTCYVIVGEDGQGELLENSLVYAGACNRATITREFSTDITVKEFEKGSNLSVVDNFKNIPLTAKIFQYYTKDGSVLLTDTNDRTNGAEVLRKRSENMKELQEILTKFGLNAETPEELSAKLDGLVSKDELTAVQTELGEIQGKLETTEGELATTATELEDVKGQLNAKDATIEELTKTNEELAGQAELAKTYRQDLVTKCLELGVRAQGNAFNSTLFEKFLGTLSVDEIKGAIEGFEAEVTARFSGSRVSNPEGGEGRLNAEPKSKDDFEDERAFRAHVADEAMKLSKAEGVSIKEATAKVYAKYTKEDGSEE